jgi:hypothetical protein
MRNYIYNKPLERFLIFLTNVTVFFRTIFERNKILVAHLSILVINRSKEVIAKLVGFLSKCESEIKMDLDLV